MHQSRNPDGRLYQSSGSGFFVLAVCCSLLFSSCALSKPDIAKDLATPPATLAAPASPPWTAPAEQPRVIPSATSPRVAVPGVAADAAVAPSPPDCASPVAATDSAGAGGAVRPASATVAVAGPPVAKPASGPNDSTATTTIAEVLQYAIAHHPLLQIRQHEVEAARAKLVTAGLLPNPELMVDAGGPDDVAGPARLNARLMFKLPIGPKREWRTAAAESGIRESQLGLSRETKAVLTEAADAAIEVLYLQELAALYGKLSGLADRVVEIQKARFEVAAVPYRNVVLTELSASNIELARRSTLERLERAKVRLARAMGLPDGSPPPLEGRLGVEAVTFAPLPDVLARARRVAPELAQAQAAVQEGQEQLALEKWKAVPDLSIGPHFVGQLGAPADERVSARALVDLPIFDRNQGRIAEQAADLETRCAKRALTEVATLNDVASLYVELQNVQSQAEYYGLRIKPLLGRTEEALRGAFEDRAVTAYELTDLLESLARMRLHDVEVRYEHQRLRTQLEVLLECPLSRVGPGQTQAAPAEIIPAPAGKTAAPPPAPR
jgi:cobalt-zinc-cadmium efflux system outer membrane protein